MNLSDNLKKIRKEHNLSQEDLAEQLGVSRQSVSKWESGGAYPEMDKVLQICQIFNLNIDDLLHQDIKEVNNNKQEKSNINKFVDDFLDYITKTIDMFSSMRIKEKLKCIFEQLLILGIMNLLFVILGSLCRSIVHSILSFLPDETYYVIYYILEGIYLAFSLVLGIILLLHIFKVRYLDYYIVIKENTNEKTKEENIEKRKEEVSEQQKESTILSEKNLNKKLVLQKKQEKIIIRDPKHTEYKFISSLLKILLFMLKSIVAFIALMFCITLVSLIIISVISFLFIKTGLTFIGTFITLVSCIIINLIILIILYNFISNRKSKKGKLALSFAISLISIGVGIGIFFIGIPEFNIMNDTNSDLFIEDQFTFQIEEGMFLEDWHNNIEYIESDNNDIKIVYKHTPYYDIKMNIDKDKYIYFYELETYDDEMTLVRNIVKDINNKQIIDYSNYQIYVYTSKENINKLKQNRINYYEEQDQNEINILYETIAEQENKIYELKEKLQEKESRINELEEEINNYNY